MKVLLFTGLSGVGKSALAAELGRRLAAPVISERTLIHDLSREQGYTRGRHWLAAVGVNEVRRALLRRTLDVVARRTEAPLVILDGVYDPEVVPSLHRLSLVTATRVVHVTAPEGIRRERFAARLGAANDLEEVPREMELLDSSRRAAGLDEVISAADLVIENSTDLESAVVAVLAWLSR